MTQWAEMLRNNLPHRSDACRWLLSELGHFPTILKELLLSPEETVRQAAASVADAALRQCMLTAGGAGGGGRSQDGEGDAYLAAYTAAAEEQDRQEAERFDWGQDLGQGFVAVGQGGVATDAQDDDTSLAQKTVRSIFTRCREERRVLGRGAFVGMLPFFNRRKLDVVLRPGRHD